MILELLIKKSDGTVTLRGGTPASATLLMRDTLEVVCAFTDDNGNVIELLPNSLGHLTLKRNREASDFQLAARLQKNAWASVTGAGATRRYRFVALVWSGYLEEDMVADPSTPYNLIVEYVAGGKPYKTQPVPCIIIPTTSGNDVVPPVPTASYRRPWAREIFGPSEPVDDATRYVGHIDKGGPLKSIRLSLESYAPGLSVMLKHNGENLFTSPVPMTADTIRLTDADDPLLFARLTVLDGAKITCVTAHNEEVYGLRSEGLQAEFTILTDEVSQIETEPSAAFAWLMASLVGAGITWDEEEQTGTIAGGGTTPDTSGFSMVDGALRFTLGGITYEIPAFPVP